MFQTILQVIPWDEGERANEDHVDISQYPFTVNIKAAAMARLMSIYVYKSAYKNV